MRSRRIATPDTTVLEPDTTVDPEAPPEPDASLETDDGSALETDAGTLETTGDESEEERTFTAAEVKAAQEESARRVQGQWEKWREEEKVKAQAEADNAAYGRGLILASAEARRERTVGTYQQLAGVLKAAYDAGKDAPDWNAVSGIIQRHDQQAEGVARYIAHDQYARERLGALRELFPGYSIPAELAEEGRRAQAAFNYRELARVDARIMADAAMKATLPRAEAAAQAKVNGKAKAAATTDAIRTATTRREPGPTGGAIAGGSRSYTVAQLDAMSVADYMDLGDKATRDRIRADAYAREDRKR